MTTKIASSSVAFPSLGSSQGGVARTKVGCEIARASLPKEVHAAFFPWSFLYWEGESVAQRNPVLAPKGLSPKRQATTP